MAIENISMGMNNGNVSTLVMDNLLFLEIVMDEVIEDMKTILKRERLKRAFIDIKYDKLIFKMINITGENIKNKINKLR